MYDNNMPTAGLVLTRRMSDFVGLVQVRKQVAMGDLRRLAMVSKDIGHILIL